MFEPQAFTIEFRKQQNTVHLRLAGYFDGPAAYRLADLLQGNFRPGDRVFIGTERLRWVAPGGRSALRTLLRWIGVPSEAVYFKGSKAPALAYDGSKVITFKAGGKCGCGKDCATCGGKKGKKNGAATRDEQVH